MTLNTYNIEYEDTIIVVDAEGFKIEQGALVFYKTIAGAGGTKKEIFTQAVCPGWKQVFIVDP